MKSTPWIRLLAYQEQPSFRQAPQRVDTDAGLGSRTGRRIVDQLRAAVAADMASAGHAPHRLALRIDDRPPFGFQVTSTDTATPNRTLAIALVGRTVSCKYCVVNADAMHSKSRWMEFVADQRALVVWDQGVRRRFDGIESLATFLLAGMSAFETHGRDA
ncbi:MAG TPA: hypothetical protein VFP91_23230 [Vicinamibacterales bacterium]|nr:hypothetical protein [Vicinamibacterales bacterium]